MWLSSTTTRSPGCGGRPAHFFEASADLGANGFQTFLYVTLPDLSTAILAGALLAFALSFDEVVVTFFTAGAQNTLPLLIYGFIRRARTCRS